MWSYLTYWETKILTYVRKTTILYKKISKIRKKTVKHYGKCLQFKVVQFLFQDSLQYIFLKNEENVTS